MSTLFGKKKTTTNNKRTTTTTTTGSKQLLLHEVTDDVVDTDNDELLLKQNSRNSNDDDDIVTVPPTTATTTTTTTTTPMRKEEEQAAVVSTTTATFKDLGLVEPLVNVCQNILSYKIPTPVQRTMIPYLLLQQQQSNSNTNNNQRRRFDACITAATGSGKTASYLLPIIQHCSIDPTTIHTIVITPTRELAVQIHQQAVLFGGGTTTYNLQSLCIVGGTDIVSQANALYNHPPHIVITTPGRLATILQNPCPPRNIHTISYLIIDEADRIFPISSSNSTNNDKTKMVTTNTNCGFTRDMEIIFQHIFHPQTQRRRPSSAAPPTTTTTTTTTSATNNRQRQQLLRYTAQSKPTLLFYSATCTNQNYHYYQKLVHQYILHNNDDGDDDDDRDRGGCISSSSRRTNNTIVKPTQLQRFIISEDFIIQENEQDERQTTTATATKTTDVSSGTTTITTNSIPAGLKQEYIFMPLQVRDAYLLGTIRTILAYGGTKVKVQPKSDDNNQHKKRKHTNKRQKTDTASNTLGDYDDIVEQYKPQSAILFVSTCERAAFISELLKQVGVPNVTLHSLVSTQQSVRNKILSQFQSEYVRIIVATDIASRGLDLPRTDIVINVDMANVTPMTYIHRIGRTARAGRRGRAISLVTEQDIGTVQSIEQSMNTTLQLCGDMNDTIAMSMLSTTVKASRLAKLQLEQINFHVLVQKMKERKLRDQHDRRRIQQQLQQRNKKEQQPQEPIL